MSAGSRAERQERRGTASPVGRLLKHWRERRGLSQLDLAGAAEISQRHLSFLESGRTAPSRAMVLRLAGALDVPFRQQNAFLLAAGYAPAWHERDLSAPELAKVTSALDYILRQQEPYPAFVVDRRWTLLRANEGAGRLTEFLTGPVAAPPPPGRVNLAEALLSPSGLRPFIVNWEEVALYFLRGVQADAVADNTPETAELLARLLAFPGLPALSHVLSPGELQTPVLTMHFRRQDVSLRLFTTIATLGTPLDITLQELRIECFFPADDDTARKFQDWANVARTRSGSASALA
jgi:transcriptional regulator with XRE-family HTH domain